MADRRTVKTEMAIESQFIQMLQTQELNTITVADIVRACNISRGTFYLHYQDVYALYDHIIARITQELTSLFDASYPQPSALDGPSFIQFLHQVISYITTNQQALDALLDNQRGQAVIANLRSLFIDKLLAQASHPVDAATYTQVAFCISGIMGVLLDRVDEHQHISEVQLEKIITIVLNGI